jgi:hypothetical protein
MYRQAQRAVEGRAFDTCLDVACGEMEAASWVPCRTYIGLDLDGERLKKGLASGPGREAIHSRIEDMEPTLRADLVLCFETIGVNQHAPTDHSVAYVEQLVRATAPRGMLIFNLGAKAAHFAGEVHKAVVAGFEKTHVHHYGRFKSARWRPVTPLLVAMMMRWPKMAAGRGRGGRLFVAERRLV